MAPLTLTPCSQAWRWASRPGKAGSSEGCTLRMRPAKARDEGGREQAHVAGEADEVDAVLAQERRELAVVVLARRGRGGRGTAAGDAGRGAPVEARRPSRTFEITTAISPPEAARAAAASMQRLEVASPRPLIEDADALLGLAHSKHDAGAGHHGADDEARLAPALEGVLDVVEVLGGDDHDHADAHVEGAEHLVVADAAALLDQPEERRHLPGAAADAGAQARRAARAGCCRGSRRR